MKKLLYSLVFVVVAGLAVSCTEEEIKPQVEGAGTNSQTSDKW